MLHAYGGTAAIRNEAPQVTSNCNETITMKN